MNEILLTAQEWNDKLGTGIVDYDGFRDGDIGFDTKMNQAEFERRALRATKRLKPQNKYKMEDWSVGSTGDAYTAPELRRPILQGIVKEHPKAGPNGELHTSPPVKKVGERTIETRSGTHYELGTPDPKWVELYPDAEARFFANFDEAGTLVGVKD